MERSKEASLHVFAKALLESKHLTDVEFSVL